MSHVAKIQLQFKDATALAAISAELGLTVSEAQVSFYDGTTVTGTTIALPGWRYPLVIDATGTLHYDNYQGRWGDPTQLKRFRQAYSTEVATRWARQQGYTLMRQLTPDGHVRLTLS